MVGGCVVRLHVLVAGLWLHGAPGLALRPWYHFLSVLFCSVLLCSALLCDFNPAGCPEVARQVVKISKYQISTRHTIRTPYKSRNIRTENSL